jgi:hypothetical protein
MAKKPFLLSEGIFVPMGTFVCKLVGNQTHFPTSFTLHTRMHHIVGLGLVLRLGLGNGLAMVGYKLTKLWYMVRVVAMVNLGVMAALGLRLYLGLG